MINKSKQVSEFIFALGFTKTTKVLFDLSTSKILNKPEFKVNIQRHPVYFRTGTTDFQTFQQIFIHKEYDVSYPDNPKTIIDLGANVGMSSLYYKQRFPDALVIAVEPEHTNYLQLKRNLEGLDKVITINKGIWNKSAYLKVISHNSEWMFEVKEVAKEEMDVEAVSINDLVRQYSITSIDILKIDVEASEKEVFSENLEWLKITKCIIIELHDWMKKGCSKTFFNALDHLKLEYELFVKGENVYVKFLNRL